jgi:alpha-D-ribose 1-methylphosphonate 5-triphosphate synthase subunit PhnG
MSTTPLTKFSIEERYSYLAAADPDDLTSLADEILATGVDVEVVSGPEAVSTPLRYPLAGTQSSTTVLGHVVLTRCTVTLAEVRGDGIRPGRDLEGAVAAAICDAEAERSGPMTARVHQLCEDTQRQQQAAAAHRAQTVHTTRIDENS